MSILSTNTKLIKVGQDYSAGSGISIDDHVISVTGEFGNTYSAGDNISIYEQNEQLYISSKDWTNDIANASANAYNKAVAQIPDPFDPTFISAKVDNKLDTTAFTNWQNGQYSTDLQTIEGQISNKLDESAFGEVSGSFLTAINIPESAVWQDVSTTVQSNSAQWADGGSGDEEVNSFVYNNSATIVDVDNSYKANSGNFLTAAPSDMATTGDVAELEQTISETYQVKGDYLVRSDSANFYPSNNPSGFVTGVDLSNYYTKYETSGKEELANAFANIPAGDTGVNTYVQNNSATINEVNTTYQSNSSNYITAHQSLDGYATTAWVNEQGYLTEVSIPESATWNEVSTTVQTNSAQWGQGGGLTGDYVSGVNFVKTPYGEGEVRGTFCSANVSGDVSVDVGEYDGTSYYNHATYSLTSLGSQFNDKLDANIITDSKTLKDIDGKYEVFEKSYRHTGTATASADNVEIYDNGSCFIHFTASNNNYLKNATIILESNTLGFVDPAVWDKVSYENNSATLTKYYRYDNLISDYIQFNNSDGWNVTNCDATCTTYSGFEMAELAFKDEIPSVVGNIPVSNSGDLYKVEFDGIDLYGYKSTTTISSEPVYSSLSSQESPSIQNTQYPSWNNDVIDYFQWVGFDVITISSNGEQIYPSDYGNDNLTALDVYYKADYLYDNNNIQLPPFSGYIGKITLDNLVISSYIDKPSYFNEIVRCDEFRLWFSGNYYKPDIYSKYIGSVGKYVQSEPRTVEGIFVIPQSALPTYEYDTNTNKISAINGSALAGGGEVPTGTMNVSGLEYNAVNEISAYNGSAIAQYGAEKQWLVHDDTIVHISNSAQYAFGCNISALQRLMGIDETVLYDDNSDEQIIVSKSVDLNDNWANYNRIKINYMHSFGPSNYTHGGNNFEELSVITNAAGFTLGVPGVYTDGGTIFFDRNSFGFTSANPNKMYIYAFGSRLGFTTSGTWNTTNNRGVRNIRVIGIGRKQ